jgi:biopolymer transport protein ExbD
MASLFHRSRQRRAERAPLTDAGHLNLVPLIDVLTSIVFFSLLTYTGAVMAMLTAFDLSLPPTVITADDAQVGADQPKLNLLVAVRIWDDSLRVEHSEEGGFRQRIAGTTDRSLEQLEQVMTGIRQKYRQNTDVLVVPSDEVLFDDIIRVFDKLRLADFRGISLGARARTAEAPARR